MIRYRQLSGRPDPAARATIRDEQLASTQDIDAGDRAAASVIAAVSAPVQVNVYEGSASIDEVGRLLLTGKLAPTDLVDGGTGWTTIDGFLPLSDQVQQWHGRARRKRLVLVVAGAGALALAAAVVTWLAGRG